jgi:tetratricopeptide (TPR) repeat protein/transcriptional regulator with XRE-family HTH domain
MAPKNASRSAGDGRSVIPDGRKIRQLRKALGLSQENLHNLICTASKEKDPVSNRMDYLGTRTIEKMEKGERVWLESLRLVAKHLNVRVEELILPEPQVWTANLPTPLSPGSFFGREEELKVLDEAWDMDDCRVVTVVGGWGTGKSALVNEWLQRMEQANYRGAIWVVGWSFRGQGSREDGASGSFFHYALTCLKDRNPDFGLEQVKAIRLIGQVKNHRTLLVLDGLEPLQKPPTAREKGGQITQANEALRWLIRHLARHMDGLCVITTRSPVQDLEDLKSGGWAREICLGGLEPADAVRLLKHQDLQGSEELFNEAARGYNHHPLSLSVLAAVLHRYYEGNLARYREVPGSSETIAEILNPLMDHLSSEEKAVMKIVGLFDGPAVAEAVQAVRAGPPIPGLTDALKGPGEDGWMAALNNLRELHLLEGENKQRQRDLDCHPEVRAYFAKRLQRDAWREGHSRLYHHFKKEESLKEVNPKAIDNLYQAIHHGCKADCHAEVFDQLVWEKMAAGFALKRVNAHGAGARDEMTLRYFVPDLEPQCTLKGFDGERKGRLFLWAAVVLHVLGRVQAAVEFAKRAKETFEKTQARLGFWCSSAYLSWFLAASGELDEAVRLAEGCIYGVEKYLQDEPIWKEIALCLYGCMLLFRGELDKALEQYKKAMIQKCAAPNHYEIVLAILRFHYACLLLKLNSYEEAESEARNLISASKENPTLGFLGYQILARMELAKASAKIVESPRGKREKLSLGKVKKYLDKGKKYLKLGPAHDQVIVHALFMAQFNRLSVNRLSGNWEEAHRYLTQAEEAAAEGFVLLNMDCLLERAWLLLDQGETEQATDKCKTVRDLVERHDYHWIDKELDKLEKKLPKGNRSQPHE